MKGLLYTIEKEKHNEKDLKEAEKIISEEHEN